MTCDQCKQPAKELVGPICIHCHAQRDANSTAALKHERALREKAEAELERIQKQAAEMREFILAMKPQIEKDGIPEEWDGLEHVLSSDAGSYYVHKADVKRREQAMRAALDDLVGQACEFIGPDEDGHPECVCCGMSLDTVSIGHKADCLAQAIMNQAGALLPNAGSDLLTPEQVKEAVGPLVEFARNCATNFNHDVDGHRYKTYCRVCGAENALAHAREKGWTE